MNFIRGVRLMAEATKFKEVVERELLDVRKRRMSANVPEDGLPRILALQPEEGRETEISKAVTETLGGDDQEKAWQDAIDKEGARCYAGHDGLVGLAFSGGGIRSATFNLGVLQALEKCGIWGSIDYLSTVSGGGYLGSCLSSLNARGPASFPFRHKQGQAEPDTFRHLRNNANYIAPNGILDSLRAPAILLRGMVFNLMVVLPWILFASIITIWINPLPEALGASLLGDYPPFSFFFEGRGFAGTLTLLVLLLLLFALYPLALRVTQKFNYFDAEEWQSRNRFGKVLGGLLALIAGVAFIEFQPLAILWFGNRVDDVKNTGIDWQDWTAMLGTAGSALAALSAGKLAERISGLVGKLGLLLLGLLGFFLLWLIYLNLCRWAIFGAVPDWLKVVPEGWVYWVGDILLGAGMSGILVVYTSNVILVYAFVAVLLWLYSYIFVDVNYTSLHNFYRDRLSKAYLIRADESNGLAHNDSQKLSDLNAENAPYHLINAAINLKDPEQPFRRGRQADSFMFSKYFIGGPPTQYCKTSNMERVRSHVNLGTAMAVSAAAFAGTAGKATIKPLAFLLAMLNVRLNYWLPNPRYVTDSAGWLGGIFKRAGPFYLFSELFGWLNANSWNVDISDGGHFENLGVYELLRRECAASAG